MAEINDVQCDPFARFGEWLGRALAIDPGILPEPTAFSLATVSADGQPSARMLLLKGFDERGFVFYTNLESRKGDDLLARPRAAMCFHWQALELQVRIEGSVTPVSGDEADAYFATRARGSQIGAWASLQSREIEAEGDLERRYAEVEERFAGAVVPRPPHWSGFVLNPHSMEFWQGRASRLHVRERYLREGGSWRVERLYP